jgi:NhaP-type Na+/H+ or K+/H+ antiporter
MALQAPIAHLQLLLLLVLVVLLLLVRSVSCWLVCIWQSLSCTCSQCTYRVLLCGPPGQQLQVIEVKLHLQPVLSLGMLAERCAWKQVC